MVCSFLSTIVCQFLRIFLLSFVFFCKAIQLHHLPKIMEYVNFMKTYLKDKTNHLCKILHMNPFLIKPLWIQSFVENLMALAIILNTHACANSIKYPFITNEQSKCGYRPTWFLTFLPVSKMGIFSHMSFGPVWNDVRNEIVYSL